MSEPAPGATPGRSGPPASWIAGGLFCAALGIALYHGPLVQFYCDDSYISFRYAENLASGKGLVFNEGERVEGYTNFLWVLLLALGIHLGVGVEVWSLALGVMFLTATLLFTAHVAHRMLGSATFGALAAVLLASLGPIVLWSTSGLETICYTLVTLLAVLAYQGAAGRGRRLAGAGLLYALSTMVRPDGVVFGAAAGLHLVLSGLLARQPLARLTRSGAALAGGFLLLLVPFVLWRHAYYDDWLPNTFYVKSGSSIQLTLGLEYLRAFTQDYPALWLLTVSGLALGLGAGGYRRLRSFLWHIALLLALFSAYVAWAGGDYMALYRFLVPLLPFAVLATLVALHWCRERLHAWVPAPSPVRAGFGLAVIAALSFSFLTPSLESARGESRLVHSQQNMRVNSRWWSAAGRTLERKLWPDATIATTAAGAIPFHARRRALDQSGLCDRRIAKEEWDPWILDKPGHMKQATHEYLIAARPDLILWHPRIRPAGHHMNALPPSADYRERALKIDGLVDEEGSQLWLYFFLHRDRLADGAKAGMVKVR